MIDLGLALSVGAILVASLSMLYARTQAVAARGHAEVANRLATHEIAVATWGRYRESRRRALAVPAFMAQFMTDHPGSAALVEEVGGFDVWATTRDLLDVAQETYLLRAAGILPDAAWEVWVTGEVGSYGRGKVATYWKVFERAAKTGLLHDGFVEFCQDIRAGTRPRDPLVR